MVLLAGVIYGEDNLQLDNRDEAITHETKCQDTNCLNTSSYKHN